MREPESVSPFLLQVRRRNRRILIATILVFVVPLGYVVRSFALSGSRSYRNLEDRFFAPERYEHDLSAEQRATIHAAIAEARARADETRKKWRAAMDAAIAAGITERPDLGRCPTRPLPPDRIKGQLPSRPEWLTYVTSPTDLPTATPARWASFDRRADGLDASASRQHTDRDAERLVKEAQAFAKEDPWTWDVLMIVDKRVEGVPLVKEEGFSSGEVEGRAWLYDYKRAAVTCAARVHAENSDEVRFRYTRRLGDTSPSAGAVELAHALENDLQVESYRAAAQSMRFLAGPPLPAEPPAEP